MAAALGAYVAFRKPSARSADAAPESKLTRRSFPGFSVELPPGNQTALSSEYAQGSLVLAALGGHAATLELAWSPSDALDEPALLAMGHNIANRVHAAWVVTREVTGTKGHTFWLDGDETALMTYVPCGARAITIVTSRAGLAQHTRIVQSFECDPDPALDAATDAFPLAIDLPGYRIGQQLVGRYFLEGDFGPVLVARRTYDAVAGRPEASIASELVKEVDIDAEYGARGHLTALTRTTHGIVRVVPCGRVASVILANGVDEAGRAELERRVRAAHCLAAGEAAPTWPAQ